MFYKKSDAEIFCETLLTLTDKQEKFVENYGFEVKSPYVDAIRALIGKIEHNLDLSSKHATLDAQNSLENPETKKKPSASKTKDETPKRRFFHSTKSQLQVLHGHADDATPIQENRSVPPAPIKEPVATLAPPQAAWEDKASDAPITVSSAQVIAKPTQITPNLPKPMEVVTVDSPVTADNIDQLAETIAQNFDNTEDPTLEEGK